MSVAEEVEKVLNSGAVPALAGHRLSVVVEDAGDDEAIVGCDRPADQMAAQLLGQEVAPTLEQAGFRVERRGKALDWRSRAVASLRVRLQEAP